MTNPRLKQDNVVYFPNTTSCGTATAISVPCMFSNMPRQNYDEELAHHQEGLLDIISARVFRYCGMKTTAAVKAPAIAFLIRT
jgi:glucan phosphoethanolaminetransferase (alkaline phosphatase superfamily)